VPWSELAGIYVVGGASAFPPIHRRLRDRFGAHRVRRSQYPFGSCAIGLAIHLDAGYRLSERLTRHFGVFREAEAGEHICFDVLVPKDTLLPVEVSRRYRAAHNVGHLRFVECGRIEHGRPDGNLAAWDEVLFPFDPGLRQRKLTAELIRRLEAPGPDVEEVYRCAADGTVHASLRVIDDGFERTVELSPRDRIAPAPPWRCRSSRRGRRPAPTGPSHTWTVCESYRPPYASLGPIPTQPLRMTTHRESRAAADAGLSLKRCARGGSMFERSRELALPHAQARPSFSRRSRSEVSRCIDRCGSRPGQGSFSPQSRRRSSRSRSPPPVAMDPPTGTRRA
jgi:hypothetical protein